MNCRLGDTHCITQSAITSADQNHEFNLANITPSRQEAMKDLA